MDLLIDAAHPVKHKSFFFVRRKQLHVLAGSLIPKSLFPLGEGVRDNVLLNPINVPAKWRVNPSNGLSRVHERDIQTDDRQIDHATEKCVGVGGIARAARRDFA